MLLSRFAAVLAAILTAAVLAFSSAAHGEVAVPPLKAAVTDLTGTLSAQQLATLDGTLKAFAQQRGSQVAVLLVPTTQPETIEQYSIRVAEAWKIGRSGEGRGKDDGVILIVAKNDRSLRIEVGYGLEGAIPDAIAKRIVAETITPQFRAGDFNAGLVAGTASIMKLIEGEKLPPPSSAASGASSPVGNFDVGTLFSMFIAMMVVGGIAKSILGRPAGALVGGGFFGFIAWIVFGSLVAGVLAAMAGFLLSLFMGGPSGGMGGGMGGRGGWGAGGGSWGGGGSGGGFGGGGGGFGGGGASGRW